MAARAIILKFSMLQPHFLMTAEQSQLLHSSCACPVPPKTVVPPSALAAIVGYANPRHNSVWSLSVVWCVVLHKLLCHSVAVCALVRCLVYSGMNRHMHDKLNVIRLDPEGSNHYRYGSQSPCYAT